MITLIKLEDSSYQEDVYFLYICDHPFDLDSAGVEISNYESFAIELAESIMCKARKFTIDSADAANFYEINTDEVAFHISNLSYKSIINDVDYLCAPEHLLADFEPIDIDLGHAQDEDEADQADPKKPEQALTGKALLNFLQNSGDLVYFIALTPGDIDSFLLSHEFSLCTENRNILTNGITSILGNGNDLLLAAMNATLNIEQKNLLSVN